MPTLTKQKTRVAQDIRTFGEFDDHEMLIMVTDAGTGLFGYIAIHDTSLGPALGGTRLQAYGTNEEALRDVLNLSKAMSYKCALANLPFGGGKGVIIRDGKRGVSEQTLNTYARRVENLGGLFKTGTDVGISDEHVRLMARNTSHMLGVVEADRGGMSTSSAAALGVYYAMKAALAYLYGSEDFNGRRVAIKGVGKLGAELARLLYEAGADLVVADVDKAACQKLVKKMPGIKIAMPDEIHAHAVDIYAPCALGNEFVGKTISGLKCRAVVGGANNMLPDCEAGEELFRAGILYAPDYIANAGGLIYVADELEPGGFDKNRVLRRVKDIQTTMASIFERSELARMSTSTVADKLARERIKSGLYVEQKRLTTV